MGGERGVVIARVLGVASTTRGFGFAVTEGPGRLVTSGCRRVPVEPRRSRRVLDDIIGRFRPSFLAFNSEAVARKRRRGRLFERAVTEACARHGVRLMPVTDHAIRMLSNDARPTKWDVARAISRLFPEIAHKMPPKRKPWQSEDDRIGIFLALAAAIRAWKRVKLPRR